MVKPTPLSKVILIAIILGGLVGLGTMANKNGWLNSIAPTGKGETKSSTPLFGKKTVKICVNTWGGFAGGVWYNKGFKPNSESEYTKKYGMNVEFKLIDDPAVAREAWKANEVDLMWTTADVFSTFAGALAEQEPVIVFQIDWSRGGDAIVVRPGINSFEDLKGKKVAVAFAQPSHTLLISMLMASSIDYSDLKIIEAPSAIDAASYFKAGKVDAAVVWSPDDEDCVQAVRGAKVLRSTKQASNIIADVFFVKRSYLEKNEKVLTGIVEGWLEANATLNMNKAARKEAAQMLADGMGQKLDFMELAVDNAYLCTYGDNLNFFGLASGYSGMTGEKLYNTMADNFMTLGFTPAKFPNWRTISSTKVLNNISDLTGSANAAEQEEDFAKPTAKEYTKAAVTTKRITVNFAIDSDILSDDAKYVIDQQLGPIAAGFARARLRIEGNTDNTGDPAYNRELSLRRAKAVGNYLVTSYRYDPDRFVILGNGPNNPVADNTTSGGRAKNRRTDFELLD